MSESGRKTRSTKKRATEKNFNAVQHSPQVRRENTSNNDDLADTVMVHPNEDDLRSIGIDQLSLVVNDAATNAAVQTNAESVEATVNVPIAVSTATHSPVNMAENATSSSASAPMAVENMRSTAPPWRVMAERASPQPGTSAQLVGVSAKSLNDRASATIPGACTNREDGALSSRPVANITYGGAIPRRSQPARVVISPVFNQDAIRDYVEIDGRTLETIRRENEEHEAIIAVQRMRSIHVDALQRMWDEILRVDFLAQSKHALQIRGDLAKQNFDEYMLEVKERHRRLTSVNDYEVIATEREQVQQVYLSIQTKIHERIAEINSLERDNQVSSAVSMPSNNGGNGDVKMDRLTIERFNGSFEKWPKFKDEFSTFVHNTNRTNTEKMLRLKSCLQRESIPYNLISGFQSTGENYEAAWGALCKEYDDDRKILEQKFLDWYDLPHVGTPPSKSKMQNLVMRTNNLIESMPDYEIDTNGWGFWMVPLLTKKLDEVTRAEWAMKRPQKVKPEVEPLLQYLKLRADGVEETNRLHYGQHAGNSNVNRQNPFSRTIHPRGANANGGSNIQSQTGANDGANASQNLRTNSNSAGGLSRRQRMFKCPDPMCQPNNDHKLYRCPRFKSLDLAQRKNKVYALGVCNLCLRSDHATDACTMRRCSACDERHNSLLCPVNVIPPVPSSVVTRPAVNCVSVAESTQERHDERPGINFGPAQASGTPNSEVEIYDRAMLGTAIITIDDRFGNPLRLRALYDPGSEVNVISTEAYQRLRLPRTRGEFAVTGVGGIEKSAKGMVSVLFTSRFESGNRFELHAIIMEMVTTKQPSMDLDRTRWPYLDGLPLADPNFHIRDKIDVFVRTGTSSAKETTFQRGTILRRPFHRKYDSQRRWQICCEIADQTRCTSARRIAAMRTAEISAIGAEIHKVSRTQIGVHQIHERIPTTRAYATSSSDIERQTALFHSASCSGYEKVSCRF